MFLSIQHLCFDPQLKILTSSQLVYRGFKMFLLFPGQKKKQNNRHYTTKFLDIKFVRKTSINHFHKNPIKLYGHKFHNKQKSHTVPCHFIKDNIHARGIQIEQQKRKNRKQELWKHISHIEQEKKAHHR